MKTIKEYISDVEKNGQLQILKQEVYHQLGEDSCGHDFYHCQRVAIMAMQLYLLERFSCEGTTLNNISHTQVRDNEIDNDIECMKKIYQNRCVNENYQYINDNKKEYPFSSMEGEIDYSDRQNLFILAVLGYSHDLLDHKLFSYAEQKENDKRLHQIIYTCLLNNINALGDEMAALYDKSSVWNDENQKMDDRYCNRINCRHNVIDELIDEIIGLILKQKELALHIEQKLIQQGYYISLVSNIFDVEEASFFATKKLCHDSEKLKHGIQQLQYDSEKLQHTMNELKHILQQPEILAMCLSELCLYDIQHLSFSKNKEQTYVLSRYGQYVQDADRLDALGAIGIARCFAYGGYKGQLMYSSEEDVDILTQPQSHTEISSKEDSREANEPNFKGSNEAINTASHDIGNIEKNSQRRNTSLQHFHDKLYHLPHLMNTRMAKKIAYQRVEMMRQFERDFKSEWNGL